MKRTITSLVVYAIILSLVITTVPVHAESFLTISPATEQIQIDTESLDLDQGDLLEYEQYSDGLAAELRSAGVDSIGKIIKEYNLNNDCIVNEKVDLLIEECDSDVMKATIDGELKETYRIDAQTTVTITPLYIAEEEFIKGTPKDEGYVPEPIVIADKIISFFIDSASAATATKSSGTVYAKRSIYNRFGVLSVSTHVQCNFYYNGSKAWYKSNFDGYYIRGFLTLWGCSQWDKWKEVNGTSYTATARGVFCWGVQYEGNGIIIDEAVCRAKITCSKDGVITKSYTPSL
jgi:hypothetical protein